MQGTLDLETDVTPGPSVPITDNYLIKIYHINLEKMKAKAKDSGSELLKNLCKLMEIFSAKGNWGNVTRAELYQSGINEIGITLLTWSDDGWLIETCPGSKIYRPSHQLAAYLWTRFPQRSAL